MAPLPAGAAPRRTVGGGTVLVGAAQLTTGVAGGLSSIAVARLLGPAGAGHFGVVQSAILILGMVSALGIEVGVSYYVGGRRWPAADAHRHAHLAAGMLGALGGTVGFGVAALTDESVFRGIGLATMAVALLSLPFLLAWTFTSFLALSVERYEVSAMIAAGQAIATLVLILVLTPPLAFTGTVVAIAAAHGAVGCAGFAWGIRRLGPPTVEWLTEAPRHVLAAARFGVRSTAAATLAAVNQRLDLLLLNAFAASAVVGHYAVAVAVTSFGLLVPRSLSAVVLPRIASLAEPGDRESQRMVTRKSIRHGVVIAAVTSVAIALGLMLVPLVYGTDFTDAVVLGFILVPGVGLLGLANILAASVVGHGRPGLALRVALIVTPPTVLAYFVVIPVYAAAGAAVVSTVSYAATCALMLRAAQTVIGEQSLGALLPRRDEWRDYRTLAGQLRVAVQRRTS